MKSNYCSNICKQMNCKNDSNFFEIYSEIVRCSCTECVRFSPNHAQFQGAMIFGSVFCTLYGKPSSTNHRPMSYLKNTFLLISASLVGGCSVLQGGKLLAPESFGLTPVTPSIYVEASADEETRINLESAMIRAEDAIHATYGSVNSRPIVNACVSERCYEEFGGQGSVAKVYGNRILLSPRGLSWNFLAHEWSHAEMLSRQTLRAWWHMPQWFDEGVAVAVSEAPEHSESHWRFLVATGVPRPTREELHTFTSLRKWLGAVHRYGDDKNMERKAKGKPEMHPLYAAAGHELRPWLAKVGSTGLLALIERLNNGEEFESAYQAVLKEYTLTD